MVGNSSLMKGVTLVLTGCTFGVGMDVVTHSLDGTVFNSYLICGPMGPGPMGDVTTSFTGTVFTSYLTCAPMNVLKLGKWLS